MRKIVLLLLTLSFSLASELNRASDIDEAFKMAKKENKHVMVLMIQDNCQYCKKMKRTTFKESEVIERINNKYIFVQVHRRNDVYPENLKVSAVPTTFFLYEDGRKISVQATGFWNKENFMSFMDDADYYMKKNKNKKGK